MPAILTHTPQMMYSHAHNRAETVVGKGFGVSSTPSYPSQRAAPQLAARGRERVGFTSRPCTRTIGRGAVRVSCADLAPGVVKREVLEPMQRTKSDSGDDRGFYSQPRMCYHVDDSFLAQLTQLYRERIPANGAVLDLMSSWVSHLPNDVAYGKVVGHGMNAEELAKNPQLSEFFVRDLNASPGFAAADGTFDAVICCVSVQYMQYPEKVFAEIFRVLKPGGVCIMSFSNRMFYQKAVSAWRDGTGYSRIQLVKQYFSCVTGFTEPEVVKEVGVTPDNSILGKFKSLFKRSSGDPFYAVVAYRNFKAVHE